MNAPLQREGQMTIGRSAYGLERCNVLFATLDSCRYDSLLAAHAPFMKSIAPLRKAKTQGTFTLPAHMSFFMGYLPTVEAPPYDPYYSDARQLWRLASGRQRSRTSVGLLLDGANILDGYRKLGFRVIGTGGVRWFRNRTLTDLFDDFWFFGPDDSTAVFTPRTRESFALNHVETLAGGVGRDLFFLFVNCLETHVPYDTGDGDPLSSAAQRIITRAAPIWGCKPRTAAAAPISAAEFQTLHQLQIRAVEAVDLRLAALASRLPRPLLVVITGDHGECFGEDAFWGHGYPADAVMDVPLIIGVLS